MKLTRNFKGDTTIASIKNKPPKTEITELSTVLLTNSPKA
jgi:hypothetical protein